MIHGHSVPSSALPIRGSIAMYKKLDQPHHEVFRLCYVEATRAVNEGLRFHTSTIGTAALTVGISEYQLLNGLELLEDVGYIRAMTQIGLSCHVRTTTRGIKAYGIFHAPE